MPSDVYIFWIIFDIKSGEIVVVIVQKNLGTTTNFLKTTDAVRKYVSENNRVDFIQNQILYSILQGIRVSGLGSSQKKKLTHATAMNM